MSTIDKYELQERLERDCVQSASDQLQQEMMKFAEISGSPNVSKVKGILCKWHPILTNHFKDLIGNATNFTKPEAAVPNNESILYAALLSSLQAEKISIIAMQEMTRISGWDANLDGIPLTRLAVNIGACLEREIFAQQVFRKDFLAHIRLSPHQRAQVLHDRKAFSKFMAKTRAVLDDNIEARQAGWIPAWSSSLRAEIGVFIVSEGIKLLQLPTSEASPSYLSGRYDLLIPRMVCIGRWHLNMSWPHLKRSDME